MWTGLSIFNLEATFFSIFRIFQTIQFFHEKNDSLWKSQKGFKRICELYPSLKTRPKYIQRPKISWLLAIHGYANKIGVLYEELRLFHVFFWSDRTP